MTALTNIIRREQELRLLRTAGLTEGEIATLVPVESWANTMAARALFDRIHSGDLHPWHEVRADGDSIVWAGTVVRDLQAIMDAHVAKLFGCTFDEAELRGVLGEWMALWMQQPSVQQVLAERFGAPVGMGRAA